MNRPNFSPHADLRSRPPRPHFTETLERDIASEPEAPAEAKEQFVYRNIVSTCPNLGWGGKVDDKATYRAPGTTVKIVEIDGQWRELPAMPAFLRKRGAALAAGHFATGSAEHLARRREPGWR
jgi:hypothetical protein